MVGINWVVPKSVKDLFIWWQSWKSKKVKNVLWDLSSFAVLWSVWKIRNELIFQGVVPRSMDFGDMVKHRVAGWFQS